MVASLEHLSVSKKKAKQTTLEADLLICAQPFLAELTSQTDRGAALVAAAFLDDSLAAMLRASFVAEPTQVEKLLGPDRPISTFSARINLAYCMAKITKDVRDDLNKIREIRNTFAHHHQPLTFESQPIRDQCRDFRVVSTVLAGVQSKFTPEKEPAAVSPRNMFISGSLASFLVIYLLTRRTGHASTVGTPDLAFGLGVFAGAFAESAKETGLTDTQRVILAFVASLSANRPPLVEIDPSVGSPDTES